MVAPLVVLALGIGGYVLLASQRHVPVRADDDTPLPLVETIVVEPHDASMDIEVDGVVVPYRDVTVASEVAGRIAKKTDAARAGRYVRRGTLLFEIDPRDYTLEVQRLAEQVKQAADQIEELDVETANAETLVALAEEDLALQQRDLERTEELASRDVLTDSNLDEAKRKELAARNTLQSLRNQLALLRARRARLEHAKALAHIQLEKAQLDLQRTRIVAPLDGIVVEDMAERDSFVQPGTPLVKIEDTSAVEVLCHLQMQQLYWLWYSDRALPDRATNPTPPAPHDGDHRTEDADQGAADTPHSNKPSHNAAGTDESPLHVSLPNTYRLPPTPATVFYRIGGQTFAWDGVLSRYEGKGINEKTRTVPCRILVENPQQARVLDRSLPEAVGPGALRRGMYVTVVVHARPATTILQLPEHAIRPGNVVWCVDNGCLCLRRVRLASIDDGKALIHAAASEVKAGDHIVVSPLAFAHEGMPVREETKQ